MLPLKTFDLTECWLTLLKKHIFAGATIVEAKIGESQTTSFVASQGSRWPHVRRLSPVANYYTSYNYPNICRGEGESVQTHLVDALGASWDVMEFGPLPIDSDIYQELYCAFEDKGYCCEGFFRHVNWFLEVKDGGYQAYLASRPSLLKNTIKRKQKALDKAPDVELHIYQGTEVMGHIADFQQVYEKSWKEEEPYPDFIADMIKQFADKGWARLGVIYHQQIPIAAQLWIVMDGVASIYKLAYVEGYQKLSAGTVLMAQMMAYVIDQDKVSYVDFLVGDEPYKRDWMSDCREIFGLNIYNTRTIVGRLLGLKAALKSRIKCLLNRK